MCCASGWSRDGVITALIQLSPQAGVTLSPAVWVSFTTKPGQKSLRNAIINYYSSQCVLMGAKQSIQTLQVECSVL